MNSLNKNDFQEGCVAGYLDVIPKEKAIVGTASKTHGMTLLNDKKTSLGAFVRTGIQGRKEFLNLRGV